MNDKLKISLIIFDMDGLIFDTERIAISAWQKASKDFGYELNPEVIKNAIGLDFIETEKVFKNDFGNCFPYNNIKKQRIAYAVKEIEENGIPVKPGLYELLKYLRKTPILKAIATSTERERTEKYLRMAEIVDEFDTVVCREDVKKGKPEPDIFLEAAKRLNCSPLECIVLEDSESGLKAASKAGMLPVLIPDMKRPSVEVMGLVFREFRTLLEVKEFIINISE